MTKQRWWAALAIACAVVVAGCSGVEKCSQGERGCIGGPCESNDSCSFDLECVQGAVCGKPAGDDKHDFGTCMQGEDGCFGGGCNAGKCSEGFTCTANECVPSGGNVGDGDGDGDGDGPSCSSMCEEEDAVCTTDTNECFNFCSVPADGILPGDLAKNKPEPVFCFKRQETDPDITFEQACRNRCKLQCQRQDWFCGDGAECEPAFCEGADVLTKCQQDCAEGDDAAKLTCIQDSCHAARGTECRDTVCPDGAPECPDTVLCQNNAEKCGNLLFDGWCDDGDTFGTKPIPGEPVNTDSNLCPWGNDCADCGPRYKKSADDKGPVNLKQGELCNYNSSCDGHKRITLNNEVVVDLETNESWCLELTAVQSGVWRCMPDASGEGETCPDGYKQRVLQNASGQDIMVGETKVQVCIPECGDPATN
jgi:hypothetical protein